CVLDWIIYFRCLHWLLCIYRQYWPIIFDAVCPRCWLGLFYDCRGNRCNRFSSAEAPWGRARLFWFVRKYCTCICPSLGLTLAGVISFPQLFLICASLGLISFLLASQIRYKKVETSPDKTATVKFDVFEKTALQPSVLLFFITVTFGGIASYLPLYTLEKDITGIQYYFLTYAIFLMISRTFAGR